jgi:putative FmdB family regulatory protein
MPTYTYRCHVHGEFEIEQRITDPKLDVCPQPPRSTADPLDFFQGRRWLPCGQPVERLISGGTSFTLKGPGWAKDGYR